MSDPNTSELRAGDEVELTFDLFPGFVARGPVSSDEDGCCLRLGPLVITSEGRKVLPDDQHLKIVKLAPRPVYVNSEREEPVDGDVVRNAGDSSRVSWVRSGDKWWVAIGGVMVDSDPAVIPKRLQLLVDGDTGRTVPAVVAVESEHMHPHGHEHSH